jgi:hypothetical protein
MAVLAQIPTIKPTKKPVDTQTEKYTHYATPLTILR